MTLHGVMIGLTALTGFVTVKELVRAQIYRARSKPSLYNRNERQTLCMMIFPVLLGIFLFRAMIVEPFNIPSSSMSPGLVKGDSILVVKYEYGLRIPYTDIYLFDNLPKRGDVITFNNPEDNSFTFIKRLVGLPGDQIKYEDKILYVNSQMVTEQSGGLYIDEMRNGIYSKSERLDDKTYRIQIDENRGVYNFELTVPEGHYFMMGDNRDKSTDSRNWGAIPRALITGKARLVLFSRTSEDGFLWNRSWTTIN